MPVTLTCEECEEEYQRKPSEAKGSRFCSMECVYENRRVEEEPHACEWCGEDFQAKPYAERRFCSKSCQALFRHRNDNPEGHKTCSYCEESKPVEQFKARKSTGYPHSRCNRCRKFLKRLEYVCGKPIPKVLAHFEAKFLRPTPYTRCSICNHLKHDDDMCSKGRWCLKCSREWHANWRARNVQLLRDRKRRYYLRNRTHILKKGRRYNTGSIASLWHRQGGRCFWCGRRCGDSHEDTASYHADHLLAKNSGIPDDPNAIRNFVVTCPTCNISKQDKLPIEFKRYRLRRGAEKTYAFGNAISLP